MTTGYAKFKNHRCFKDHWSGFEKFVPVTLIIGKNNTGKSHLLHFVEALCTKPMREIDWDVQIEVPLDNSFLRKVFQPNLSGGPLSGDHWNEHGQRFVGELSVWTRESGKNEELQFRGETTHQNGADPNLTEARLAVLLTAFPSAYHLLHGKIFKHLLADRDIQPEPESNALVLSSDGAGATNIVRRFINSSEPKFRRELIQVEMLHALNEIFASDGMFQEITVKHHDGPDPEKPSNIWEIFLKQEHKGLVSLSASGSGLKTIFLVLLHLLVMPEIEVKRSFDYVYAFEELENNLHPSLLRNLLGLIRKKAAPHPESTRGATPYFFMTTHSNVALDYFADDKDAQIIHVSHDGKSGQTRTIDQSSRALEVIWDLGTRPSDLFQSNGIIWVEGPSDRIYLNRWIELFSGGRFKEGRHYQCAFYGGSLLSSLQAVFDEDADAELINLLKINPNVIVVSDSDRDKKGAQLKKRVRRIREEFAKLDKSRVLHWILEAREIENYLLADFIKPSLSGLAINLPSPEPFESFFPRDKESGYLGKCMKRKSFDKSKLAALTTPHMSLRQLESRFDLGSTMRRIVSIIEVWNR